MTKWKGAPPSSRRRAGEESAPATTTTTAERDGSRRRALGQIRCGTIIQERFTAPKLQIRPSLSLRLECKLLVLVFCRTIYLTPNRTTGSNNSTTHKMIAESTRKRGRQILHLTYFILSFIQPYRAKGVVSTCMHDSITVHGRTVLLFGFRNKIDRTTDRRPSWSKRLFQDNSSLQVARCRSSAPIRGPRRPTGRKVSHACAMVHGFGYPLVPQDLLSFILARFVALAPSNAQYIKQRTQVAPY
jgi:hypothetical protein